MVLALSTRIRASPADSPYLWRGTVPSYPQYLEAAAAARRVAGVKKLQNHLEVVLSAEDYRDDATLTTVANNALTLNIAVPDSIEASANNGNITLTVTVTYGSERTAAGQALAVLTGVRNVKDDIAISTDADPIDVSLNVQDALDRYALIPDDSDPLARAGGHPSGTAIAGSLVRSTREHRAGRPQALAQAPRPEERGTLLTLLRVGFTKPLRSPERWWSLTPQQPSFDLRRRN